MCKYNYNKPKKVKSNYSNEKPMLKSNKDLAKNNLSKHLKKLL